MTNYLDDNLYTSYSTTFLICFLLVCYSVSASSSRFILHEWCDRIGRVFMYSDQLCNYRKLLGRTPIPGYGISSLYISCRVLSLLLHYFNLLQYIDIRVPHSEVILVSHV